MKRYLCKGSCGAADKPNKLLMIARLSPGSVVQIKCPDSRCKTLNTFRGAVEAGRVPSTPEIEAPIPLTRGTKLVPDDTGGFREVVIRREVSTDPAN